MRPSRDRLPGLFRGSEWLRLTSMVGMLMLIVFLMLRLRDPDTLRSLDALIQNLEQGEAATEHAQEPNDGPASQASSGDAVPPKADSQADSGALGRVAEAPPLAIGPPTDEDPEEAAGAVYEFQAITDRTTEIQPEEMVPYKRVLQWVLNQSVDELRRRARRDLEFNDFVQSPAKYRGELVELVLNARLVRRCPEPPQYASPLYEVWGPTTESGAWMYAAIVANLPQGMPVGRYINEQVRVVGYFFKLQGYHPATAKPGDRPIPAPLFIGRMLWIRPEAADAARGETEASIAGIPGWIWGLGVAVLVGLVAAGAWFAGRGRRSRIVASTGVGGGTGLESWLDGARSESEASPAAGEREPVAEPAEEGPPPVLPRLDQDGMPNEN